MSHIGELQMSIEYSVGILFFKTIIIFYPLKWTVQCTWKPMKRKFVLSLWFMIGQDMHCYLDSLHPHSLRSLIFEYQMTMHCAGAELVTPIHGSVISDANALKYESLDAGLYLLWSWPADSFPKDIRSTQNQQIRTSTELDKQKRMDGTC